MFVILEKLPLSQCICLCLPGILSKSAEVLISNLRKEIAVLLLDLVNNGLQLMNMFASQMVEVASADQAETRIQDLLPALPTRIAEA